MNVGSAADTPRYHVHFVKNEKSLSDAIHFLPEFKPKFFEASSREDGKYGSEVKLECDEIVSLVAEKSEPQPEQSTSSLPHTAFFVPTSTLLVRSVETKQAATKPR